MVILRGLKDISWGGAKAMMADGSFLKSLLDFDKDGLSDKQVCVLDKSVQVGLRLASQGNAWLVSVCTHHV